MIFLSNPYVKKTKALKLARESGTAKCILAKHLTDEIFEKLKDKKTSSGTTFLDVIESGCINVYRVMGIHAPDVEAYDVFSDIYTPMILDYHGLKSPADINVIYKKVYLSFLSYTRFSGSILKRSNFNESNLNQTLRKKKQIKS